MPDTDAELTREIRELRDDIRQMKETLDLLISLVVENDNLDDECMSELLLGKDADALRFNN